MKYTYERIGVTEAGTGLFRASLIVPGKYQPHQGAREKARRLAQMAKRAAKREAA